MSARDKILGTLRVWADDLCLTTMSLPDSILILGCLVNAIMWSSIFLGLVFKIFGVA